jgi:hypothetical protein
MDIQVSNTGRIFYQVDSVLAAILLEAFPHDFKRVVTRAEREAQAAVALTPRWCVTKEPHGGFFLIQCAIGSRIEQYDGKPEKAVAIFGQMGLQCPPEIVEQYRDALKSPRAVLSALQRSGF